MSSIKPETYGYGAGRDRSSVWARWVIAGFIAGGLLAGLSW